MCWRYAPCLFSLARFCWEHSEFKRPTTIALPGGTMRSSEPAIEWCKCEALLSCSPMLSDFQP